MRLPHLKTVERRKVSQPSRNTAPPPLYRGGVVVVERAPPVRQGRGFRTLSSDIADRLHMTWEPAENLTPCQPFFWLGDPNPRLAPIAGA